MKLEFIRGVVEGFYGIPWSWQERKDIIKFMAKRKYNLYIYAPKEDEYHREFWRKQYPAEFMEEFKKLNDCGIENSVNVSVALSPGLSLVHADESERDCLVDKFMKFAEIGVKTFCLFLDDIPEQLQHEQDKNKFSTLAEAQVYYTNSVYDLMKSKVEDLKFILCPTFYFGKTVNEYHFTLGKGINPEIEIMWTGPEVCSEIISAEDAKMISDAYCRPVLYWDNYPVNDSAMVPELHIGPYSNRDKELNKYSSGIILNPMNQAYASMIVLDNAADYLDFEENFNLKESWIKSLEFFGKESSEEFIEFANANLKSPLNKKTPEITTALLAEFKKLYSLRKRREAAEYLKKFGKKTNYNYQKIKENIDINLFKDIEKWMEEYRGWGDILYKIGEIVISNLEMYQDIPLDEGIDLAIKLNGQLEEMLKKAMEYETFIFGDELLTFAMNRLKISKGLVGLYRY